jgi:ketosteroid isomerase-like protein
MLGCKGENINTENRKNTPESTKNLESQKQSIENTNWMLAINSKADFISNMYTENAIKIYPDASYVSGNKAIGEYYQKTNSTINDIRADTIILANETRAIEYELGEYYDKNYQPYKHLIIWITKDGKRKRDFEFVVAVKPSKNVSHEIDQRRNQWMELCNAHNANALITEMYSENTLYYNHKPLIIGRDSLINEYAYMNNEKYSLTLTPIVSEQVNENHVIEIGQCKGGYGGKYIIVWKKNNSGKWEVFIDSNV